MSKKMAKNRTGICSIAPLKEYIEANQQREKHIFLFVLDEKFTFTDRKSRYE